MIPVSYQFNLQQMQMLDRLTHARIGDFFVAGQFIYVKRTYGIIWHEHFDIAEIAKARFTNSDLVKGYWAHPWSIS